MTAAMVLRPTRRYTIGLHGVWTAEEARREAKVLLGQGARGGNPAEERKLDREAITVKELCTRYLEDLRNGLVLGKRGRLKKATTISTDVGRIERHIVPLLGSRRVRDLADITQAMKDMMAGKTRANVKTEKLRGRAIVRGGAGTAARTIGPFGGILTYAVELGIVEQNPAHGVRKPKDQVNARSLSEQEYRTLGDILRKAIEDRQYETTAAIIRVIALTGCRRSEVIGLRRGEVDIEGSCLRLADSKEGASVRPIGLPVLEYLKGRLDEEPDAEDYVFPGWEDGTPFGSSSRQWTKLLKNTDLAGITPHVLRHSFASIGNALGFTEATIAALVGHSRGTVTSRYVHTVDTALIMAADSIAGYIQGLLDGVAFTHTAYALDRDSRKAALAHFLGEPTPEERAVERSAA
jgi:integrase